MIHTRPSVFALLVTLLTVACGSGDASSSRSSSNEPDGTNDEGTSSAGAFDGTSTSVNSDPSGAVGPNCAGTHATLEASPLHLIVLLDRSVSMLETSGPTSSESKWVTTTKGLRTLFESSKSKGITASVIPFPAANAPADMDQVQTYQYFCGVAAYSKPDATLTATLPNSNLIPTIEALGFGSGTTTLPAINGAIAYADSIAANEKVAIVLATDGMPNSCSGLEEVVQATQKGAFKYRTYVIGMGDVDNLDALAVAGDTEKSYRGSDATVLGQALNTIRSQAMSCEYKLPTAPIGKTLDLKQVNVVAGNVGGTQTLVKQSSDCADSTGWKYDDATSPSKIVLCDSACATVQSDATVSVDVVVGCTTEVSAIN